jgi:MRG-binding protein
LGTLYDLSVLDEREDARQLEKVKVPSDFHGADTDSEEEASSDEREDDVYSEAANKIENEEFSLPGDEFAERKWTRRLATEGQNRDESPPLLPELNMADDPPVRFTPSFSIEPSEAATPASRRGQGRPGRTAKKAAAATSTTRRSTRQAESGADDEETQQDDEAAEDEDEEQSSDEEEDQSEQSTPARRGTRNAKDTRGRANQKAETRSRGRRK